MFIFGMKIMSEGLQRVAGKKLRHILKLVSDNRFVGCGAGAAVTAIIQSSSATTVMLVGFVDAGLMTLTQSIGLIIGANIGTTITAQLIAFKITAYALPAIAAGAMLKFFIDRRKWNNFGDVLLGFGLVFYGLSVMKVGFAPLRDDQFFINLFTNFQSGTMGGLLLCVFIGALLTVILQSSSATVGVTMALAIEGLIGFEASVALILGENIGTTITAQLASIGSSINARRAANAHTVFNVLGVTIVILFFPFFIDLVNYLTMNLMNAGAADALINGELPNVARYIANSHTLFNVVNALIFLMLLPYLVKVTVWFTPQKKEEAKFEELSRIKYLDNRFISTPPVALARARSEIIRMGDAVQIMYDEVIQCMQTRKLKDLSKWQKREDTLDSLQKQITQYLVKVMQQPITSEESNEIASLTRITNNLERTGDELEDIAKLIEELIDQNLYFSSEGMRDYDSMTEEVGHIIKLAVGAIKSEDRSIIDEALEYEKHINRMREDMKENHFQRLQCGTCTVEPGLILVDMFNAFEKIGGFCYNIAQSVAGVK